MAPDGSDLTMDMSLGGSAAGASPSWLPTAPSGDKPLAFLDFENGNYWAGSIQSAAQSIDQPGLITHGTGLVLPVGFTSPIIIGAAAAAIIATGALYTGIVDFQVTGPELAAVDVSLLYVAIGEAYVNWSDVAWGWVYFDPPQQSWTQAFCDRVTPTGGGGNGSIWETAGSDVPATQLPNGKFAGTMDGAHTAISYAGSSLAPQTVTHNGATQTNYPVVTVSSGSAFTPDSVRICNDYTSQQSTWVVRSVTVYTPQPDADLPTLST